MPLWVHIEPSISPDGDEAKAALTSSLKTSLTRTLVTMTSEALPPDKFTTKPEDKPKPKPKPKGPKPKDEAGFNAIKISPNLKLKVEAQGSQLTVTCKVTAIFEAIKAPELKEGASLMAQASKGAGYQNRGSGEKIAAFAERALSEFMKALISEVIASDRFKSYAKSMNLPV